MMEFFWEKLLRLKARMYTLSLSSGFYSFGRRSVIVPPLRFHGLREIQIGNNVLVLGNCWIQVVDADKETDHPRIVIRDNATIGMGATISAAQRIVIEEHVLLGRNVHISDHGHEYEDVTEPIVKQGMRKIMEVRVGAETWIGQNAVILPGASIGRHCVIGANSVVNSVVPDYCVVAGAPAKVLKRYNPTTSRWEPALPYG